ncbi:MAG: hypothetical protein QOE13_2200 [Gaiellaceae bacterium]|jgi:hypothetical protein|nr:hypothetical protein [Gaiellaceae bacterium]
MTKKLAIAVLAATLLVAGCGSNKSSSPPTTTGPQPAQTSDQWAQRVVDWFLRPLSSDLPVIDNFANSQVRFYIQTGNQEAIQTINARMNDLERCGNHLVRVGPPPGDDQALKKIDEHLRTACAAYTDIAVILLRATKLLSSGKQDQVAKGMEALKGIGAKTRSAALELTAGVKLAQARGDFRRAGLKPSV